MTNEFQNVAQAFVVGSLGAGAFFLGVFLGFICPDRASRRRLLEYLTKKEEVQPWRLVCFVMFGGVVAAVFQWAQPSVFAPIQAFVLGATWPSVVSRIMAGNNNPTPFASLPETPPDLIPVPKNENATSDDAQVVIRPNP